jgi:hypothetical protein
MVPSDGRRLYAVKAYSLAAAPAELCRLQDLRSGLHVRRDELMTAEADHSAAQEAKQESVASAFLLVCGSKRPPNFPSTQLFAMRTYRTVAKTDVHFCGTPFNVRPGTGATAPARL